MKGAGWFLTAVSAVSLVGVFVVSVVLWFGFAKNCKDYLKLAGDAPTVERADEFLGKAVGYLEEEGLTSGNSAFMFNTPTNDVGIWYNQLKSARATTRSILERAADNPSSVTQLERDNALMKIREVVLDNSSSGTSVTTPDSITWFPKQWLMLIWWIFSFIGLVVGGGMVKIASDY